MIIYVLKIPVRINVITALFFAGPYLMMIDDHVPGTYLWESGCEIALTIASTAVSKSSGSGRALKQSCTRLSLSLRGTSNSIHDERQRSTRAFTAPGLSVLLRSCCNRGQTDPHSRPRAPRTLTLNDNSQSVNVNWSILLMCFTFVCFMITLAIILGIFKLMLLKVWCLFAWHYTYLCIK